MTTGRINQVTILRVRSHTLEERSRLVTPHPRGGDQDIYKVGGRTEAQHPARETPGPKRPENRPRAIQLPPLSNPRGGPGQKWGFATLDAGPHCTIHLSVGGYRHRSHWVRRAVKQLTDPHGYRLWLAPDCLRIMIAIGQSSTDSFRAHRA